MTVTDNARMEAVNVAQALQMGQTGVAIQDGCSVEEAAAIAFKEHLFQHRNCPCCRGSEAKALTISRLIISIMKGFEAISER